MAKYTCFNCGNDTDKYYPSLGKDKPICDSCERGEGYRDGNTIHIGVPSKLPKFSFEFEVGNRDMVRTLTQGGVRSTIPIDDDIEGETDYYGRSRNAVSVQQDFYSPAYELLRYFWQKHPDGTVEAEWKSPIYNNIHELDRVSPLLNKCGYLVGEEAGTHVHVSFDHKRQLHNDDGNCFAEVLERMEDRPEETKLIWGRNFNRWCKKQAEYGDSDDRYVAFNLVSHHDTLEFRLPRFLNARQYKNVVQMCRKMTYHIEKYYEQPGRRNVSVIQNTLMDVYEKHVMIGLR